MCFARTHYSISSVTFHSVFSSISIHIALDHSREVAVYRRRRIEDGRLQIMLDILDFLHLGIFFEAVDDVLNVLIS